MRWWIPLVAAAACTRPADREAAEAREQAAKELAAKATPAAKPAPSPTPASPTPASPTPASPTPASPTPAASTAPASKIMAVEMDHRTTCARRADGQLRCWGSPDARTLGSVVPYTLSSGDAQAFDIAAGQLAVVLRSGDLALGPLAVPAQPALALITGLGEVIDARIDAPTRAWALTRTGDVYRIDRAASAAARTASSATDTADTATSSKAAINAIALSSREDGSTDALHRDGTVTTFTRGTPVRVAFVTDADALLGTRCAHLRRGGIACWDVRGKAVAWKGPLNALDRRAAEGVTCTLSSAGVACAGRNEAGQLGTGAGDDRAVAKVVALPGKPVAIAGGDRAWCAVLDGGTLACWGANDGGQLGDGTLIDRATPVVIAGAASATPLVAPARGAEPVAEEAVAMRWDDLPAGCVRPQVVPSPDGDVRVVSAYAVMGARTELWFADLRLAQGGYRRGHVVARGPQRAVVYTLGGTRVERGRFRGARGARTATVAMATLGAAAPVPADVLVEKIEDGWLCGTILDVADSKRRTPFAALIGKPRYE